MTEQELIEFAKPYLKQRGFLKKAKRWIKAEGEFTIHFFIQGSCYDKDSFYIRPGIFLNAVPKIDYYGDFWTEIVQENPEQVMNDFEAFCQKWTDKAYIKNTLLAFQEWEKRNPLENRRAVLCDYERDPVPSMVCFSIRDSVKQYIMEKF